MLCTLGRIPLQASIDQNVLNFGAKIVNANDEQFCKTFYRVMYMIKSDCIKIGETGVICIITGLHRFVVNGYFYTSKCYNYKMLESIYILVIKSQ